MVLLMAAAHAVNVHEPNAYDKMTPSTAAPPWVADEPRNIIDLDADNFTAFIDPKPVSLVLFHAPWSAAARHFYHEFRQIAEGVYKAGGDAARRSIAIAAVDVQGGNQDLAKKFNVRGLPQLAVLRYGVEGHHGENSLPRTTSTGIQHILDLVRPDPQKLTSEAQLSAIIDPNTKRLKPDASSTSKVIIGFLRNLGTQDEFIQAARDSPHKTFTFYYTDKTPLFNAFGITEDCALLFDRDEIPEGDEADDKFQDREEPREVVWRPTPVVADIAEHLKAWLLDNSMPLVGDFTAETRVGYLKKRHPMLLFFHPRPASANPWTQALRVVAQVWRNVTFAIVNPAENPALVRHLDIPGQLSRYGRAMALMVEKTKYRFEGETLSADIISSFLYDARVGQTIPPFHRSAPSPDHGPQLGSGKLIEVTYNTFPQVALNSSFDVLILFRSAQCPQCHLLMDHFEKLASRYHKVSNFAVTHFDTMANDSLPEPYNVEAPPAIFLATREGKGTPLKYKGNLQFNDLHEFIRKHATVALEPRATADNSSSSPRRVPSPSHSRDDL